MKNYVIRSREIAPAITIFGQKGTEGALVGFVILLLSSRPFCLVCLLSELVVLSNHDSLRSQEPYRRRHSTTQVFEVFLNICCYAVVKYINSNFVIDCLLFLLCLFSAKPESIDITVAGAFSFFISFRSS